MNGPDKPHTDTDQADVIHTTDVKCQQ